MNLFNLIPDIGKIIDKFVTSPDEKTKLETALKELDIREIEARAGAQRAWMSNNSFFVAGAIPSILWMLTVVILFNCVIAPLASPWAKIPTLELPEWYSSLAGTIIIGLFGKKVVDGNEFRWHGETVKPAKGSASTEVDSFPITPIGTAGPVYKIPTPTANKKLNYETKDDVDKRLAELCKEKGIEP